MAKLVLVIVFVILLVLLLPKFIQPKIVQQNCNDTKLSSTSDNCDSVAYSSLTSQIFQDNIDRMKALINGINANYPDNNENEEENEEDSPFK